MGADGVVGPAPGSGRALATLCLTVTVAYGVLYYAFTVLAPAIADDTGWSGTAVTAAFSGGSLFGAIAGIAVGRALQRRGPRLVMTTASVLGAGAMALVGVAPSYPVFVVAWLLAGTASAGLFYPPAFAALTQWFGSQRVRAITSLTLVAGFASTVFAPLTAWLGSELGWRAAYLTLAAVLLVLTTPLHAGALTLPWHGGAPAGHHGPRDRTVLTSRAFVLVAASGTVTSLAMYASLVHLVPLLLERDVGVQLAAWALGLSGAGQVAGRLLYPALDRRFAPHRRAAGVIAVLAATLLLLAVVPGPAALLIAVAIVAGAARGLFTLVAATVVSEHWGAERYAALNGAYNAPLGIAAALAPAFGAAVAAATGSHSGLFVVLALIGGCGAVLAVLAPAPSVAPERAALTPGRAEDPG